MEGEQNKVNIGMEGGGSSGLIIGGIVILAIIILGGLYFWGQKVNEEEMITNDTVYTAPVQNQSDDTASIESDLDATDVDYVDAELNAS